MFKKIIAFALCCVMVLGLAACGNKNVEDPTTEPTVNENPTEPTEKPVDLDSLDYEGWVEHLRNSEKRIQDVKMTYIPANEGDPRAEWVEGKDGQEGYWALSRRSGVFEDGTAVEEIDPTSDMIYRSFRDANGVIYCHSSETYPEDGGSDPLYVHVIEESLFIRGMEFIAKYYASQNPEPTAPVLTNVYINDDTHKIVVEADGLFPDQVDGVIIRVFNENYEVIATEQFDNIEGKYMLSFIDKGECTQIAVCSYYIASNGDTIVSAPSNMRIVPNKYYQDNIINMKNEHDEVVNSDFPTGETETTN